MANVFFGDLVFGIAYCDCKYVDESNVVYRCLKHRCSNLIAPVCVCVSASVLTIESIGINWGLLEMGDLQVTIGFNTDMV